ncbi:hypothetical protein J3A83DRAFT_4195542 [Scleroderma citrinum]
MTTDQTDQVAPWMQYNNLNDIPMLCKSSGKVAVPSKLLLLKEAMTALELHLDTMRYPAISGANILLGTQIGNLSRLGGGWIKLVTTHNEHDTENRMLLCIDEILGVFDHTDACQQLMEMDHNPQIPLHLDI